MNQRELFILSVTVFFTIFAWLLLDIYKIKDESLNENIMTNSSAINYSFNTDIFDVLKEKQP